MISILFEIGGEEMDPLDIIANKQHALPYYQAIFSADEHLVIGYEVLGRIQTKEGIRSLGDFFQDDSIPDEFRIEMDDHIQYLALEHALNNDGVLLFLNRNPDLLMIDRGESFLSMLLSFQERGLDLNRIIVEVTEHDFKGDIEQLNHLFTYFRTYGIRLAVDNVGKEGSNLDRLRLLQPDILKVDVRFLKRTTLTQSYQDVLYSLSLLARKIGATLLFEDIEELYQLQYAWKNNGRYYQGFYLSKPNEDMISPDIAKEKLKNEFHRFIQLEKKKLEAQFNISVEFNEKLKYLNGKFKKRDVDSLIAEVAKIFDEISFRVYVCDEDGFQQSANIIKKGENWTLEPEYRFKNWSWRPYFLENMMRMRYDQKGILSDIYSDIDSGAMIRTFSYPLDSQHYLFIDISYSFLFEQEYLL